MAGRPSQERREAESFDQVRHAAGIPEPDAFDDRFRAPVMHHAGDTFANFMLTTAQRFPRVTKAH